MGIDIKSKNFILPATITVIVLIFAGIFLVSLYQPTTQKIEDVKLITGTFGELKAQDKTDDDYIESIQLNGKVLVDNDHAGFEYVYPSLSKPQIVIAWSDCGGSACGRAGTTFIDLLASPVFHANIGELSPEDLKIKKQSEGIYLLQGRSSYLTNDYGDIISLSMKYDRNKKELKFISDVSEAYQKYIGEHPDRLLGDEQARAIFLRKMSASEFKDFRHSISVSSGMGSAEFGRYIIGSGMAPHSGGDPSSFFIIDLLQDRFIAGTYSEGQVKIISDAYENNRLVIPGPLLNEILSRYNMRWDYRSQSAVNMVQ